MNTRLPFRDDNTDGYSTADLRRLNEAYERLSGGADLAEQDRAALCEQILKHPPAGIKPGA